MTQESGAADVHFYKESFCNNKISAPSYHQHFMCFIKNVDFSSEKRRFGAKKGLLHYVLRRDFVIFAKSDHFELEICVKAKKGRTALQPEALLSLK